MTLFTLLNITTYLFLTYGSPTTFKFDSPIEFVSISNESDYFKYQSRDKKILVLKPTKEKIDSNVVVITKNNTYTFNLHSSHEKSPILYEVLYGAKSASYRVEKSNDDYEILSGEKINILRIKNNTKYKTVNDMPVKTEQYLPKNGKIKLDDEYVY
jgi:hypothetical protein